MNWMNRFKKKGARKESKLGIKTKGVMFRSIYEWELPRPIPQNSVEPDHGCKSGIYFDNACDNVTLTLNNLTQTSQKPC